MARQIADVQVATLEDLLAMGIELEACTQHVYEEFARMFAGHTDVAEFWQVLADDEAAHKNRLIEIRAGMSAARLSQPADAKLLLHAENLLRMDFEQRVHGVNNLDDAYEMASELECSETNTVFRFFLAELAQDMQVLTDVMQDLDDHVDRLMTFFPSLYSTRARRAQVQAIRP